MKKIIAVVIGAGLLSASISSSAANELAKELATELVVSVVGSLAENQMESLFGENKVMPKPLTKKQITEAVDDSFRRAKETDIKSALDKLLSAVESYPVPTHGDKELSEDAKDRRLLDVLDKAISVKTEITNNMSSKNIFNLLPMYIQAMDVWTVFSVESGVNTSTQNNAAKDITAKLVKTLQDLRHFYQIDFIDNGARNCIFKTDSQWWGNQHGNTIKKQYLGKKGSRYSINIKNRYCVTDSTTAGDYLDSYKNTRSKRIIAASYGGASYRTYTSAEKAFKDYSWDSDDPTRTLRVASVKTLPIFYSDRTKLRFWFLQPHLANRSNGGGGYDLKGPYHKNNDAKKERIKYAVHNYQQAPTPGDPRGMGVNVAKKMACWAKVVSVHGSLKQKATVTEILRDLSVEVSECK
jgi:hypothetical protein